MTVRLLNRRFQYTLAALFVVTTAVAAVLGLTPILRTQLALRDLKNEDVEVMCTDWGYIVSIDSPAANRLHSSGPNSNWALESALSDPKRFAAAHALLTKINQRKVTLRRDHYNEMRISFNDGHYDFHAEQISELQEFWRVKLATEQASDE